MALSPDARSADGSRHSVFPTKKHSRGRCRVARLAEGRHVCHEGGYLDHQLDSDGVE